MTLGLWAALVLAGALVAVALAWRRERRRNETLARAQRRADEARQAAEAQGQEAQAKLDLLAGEASDLLLLADPDLRLHYANPAAEARFGILSPGVSLIRFSQSSELEEQARRAASGEEAESDRVVTIQNQPFRSRVRVARGGIVLALTDASEIQRLSRARQDMVANLSHELRTPLTSLGLLVETLRGQLGLAPPIALELTTKMQGEVDTLKQMTQEMLDLAAIESGRQVVRMVPVALADVVRGPAARLAEQAARRDVRIVIEIPDDLMVLADLEPASRAVQNVVHNAVKFSPPGSEVRIGAWKAPDGLSVILRVTDQGPGIAPADLPRVFERFYRGDQARTEAGTGLGLAITRHILEAHGGEVWAENRPLPKSGAALHLRFLTG